MEEIHNLSDNERFLLLFLRTQLEEGWESYCLQLLDTWITSKQETPDQRWKRLKDIDKKWWNPKSI